MSNELDTLIFFEHARQISEATYAADPLDADNLTRWAGSLLELSQCQSVSDSQKLIQEATTKLEEALSINPNKHDALWCLGNAQTSLAFLTHNEDEGKPYFEKASEYFHRAVDEDPGNEVYLKSLQMSAKAPELHQEIVKHGQTLAGPSTSKADKKEEKNDDLKYDIFGWIILAVGFFAWVGFSKSQTPPPLR